MFFNFAALGTFQYSVIAILGIAITAVVLFFLLRQGNIVKASDGTEFNSEKACQEYELLLGKVTSFYNGSEGAETIGLQPAFLKNLKEGGFSDAKTLINYRLDFKKLSSILEEIITD